MGVDSMKCVVCGAHSPEPFGTLPLAHGWDWFTGYLDETAHFCPRHANSGMRHLLHDLSQRKPDEDGKRWSMQQAARHMRITFT
jgi:hypothetical protein